MIAGERQARDNRVGRTGRNRPGLREPVADDAVVHLGVKCAVVERDAGTAGGALRSGPPKRLSISALPSLSVSFSADGQDRPSRLRPSS